MPSVKLTEIPDASGMTWKQVVLSGLLSIAIALEGLAEAINGPDKGTLS